jgi:hypothetical protein
MTRVAAFLRARIDDDERAILEEFERLHIRVIGETLSRAYHGSTTTSRPTTTPRALVRCNTDRRIVAMHDQDHECPESEDDSCGYWDDRACLVIRLLAVPYSDHPDYDEEWRP